MVFLSHTLYNVSYIDWNQGSYLIIGSQVLNTLAFALSLVILGLTSSGVNTDLVVACGNIVSGGTRVSTIWVSRLSYSPHGGFENC